MTPEEAKMFDIQQVYIFELPKLSEYDLILEEIQNEETYS